MLVCSRSVGQGANWLTVAGRSIRSGQRHRVIRRVQDENGRRDRFPPRGGVPVILLGRPKGSFFRFLDFPPSKHTRKPTHKRREEVHIPQSDMRIFPRR